MPGNFRHGNISIMDELIKWRMTLTPPTLANAARLLGVSVPHVSRMENGVRAIPVNRVVEFERVTGIPRQKLRPDLVNLFVQSAGVGE